MVGSVGGCVLERRFEVEMGTMTKRQRRKAAIDKAVLQVMGSTNADTPACEISWILNRLVKDIEAVEGSSK